MIGERETKRETINVTKSDTNIVVHPLHKLGGTLLSLYVHRQTSTPKITSHSVLNTDSVPLAGHSDGECCGLKKCRAFILGMKWKKRKQRIEE